MKLPARILIPIGSAILIVCGLLAIIWWQLSLSTSEIALQLRGTLARNDILPFASEDPIDASDRILLHIRAGDVHALRGDWGQAQEEYQTAVQQGGGIPALRKLAVAQLQRRDLDGVRKTLQQLEQEGTPEEHLLLLRSIFLLRTGELVQAGTLLEGAPASPQRSYGLALLAIIKGEHEKAKQELAAVQTGDDLTLRTYARYLQAAYDEFAQFPESPEIHRTALLAQGLARVNECEIALPLIATVIAQQSDYRDAWMVQGYCELTTERFEQALNSFSRAYALDPQKPEIQYFLGRAYATNKRNEDARMFFGYALQNGFQPAREVHERLADVELSDNKPAVALDHYRAILDDPTANANINDVQRFVTLAISNGNKEEAYQTATQATQAWPDDAISFELLGMAAAATDRTDEANAAFTKALELDPTLETARAGLGKL